MREKIVIQKQKRVRVGAGYETTWETFYSPKSVDVEETSPSIEMLAGQENVSSIIKIKMRYNPEVYVKNGDRIIWRGFNFNSMKFVVDRVKRWIYIFAVAEMETTDRNETES